MALQHLFTRDSNHLCQLKPSNFNESKTQIKSLRPTEAKQHYESETQIRPLRPVTALRRALVPLFCTNYIKCQHLLQGLRPAADQRVCPQLVRQRRLPRGVDQPQRDVRAARAQEPESALRQRKYHEFNTTKPRHDNDDQLQQQRLVQSPQSLQVKKAGIKETQP